MDPLSLFTLAPGLPAPWEVVDVAFDPQSGRIDFHRAFAPGTRCSCPQCGAEHPPVHDTLERDWRHLNCFQFQASIHAKVPRVRCGTCAKTTPRSWRSWRRRSRSNCRIRDLIENGGIPLIPYEYLNFSGYLIRNPTFCDVAAQ